MSLLTALCASLSTAAQHNTIGGDGGTAYTLQCPPGQFGVGLSARHDGNRIITLNLRCAAADPSTGNWQGTPRWQGHSPTTRPNGTSGLSSSSLVCGTNDWLEPFMRGHTSNLLLATVVSGLVANCVRHADVDPASGFSRTIRRAAGRVGARFSGTEQISTDVGASPRGLTHLSLRYGLALDSIRVNGRSMPWVQSTARPASATFLGGSSRSAAPNLPDLAPALTSALWRYDGSTQRNGITFRKVSDRFCETGMRSADGGRTLFKNFTLPPIGYEVRNVGSTTTGASSQLAQQFGSNTVTLTVPELQPGERQTFSITRGSIQRCVTTGDLPGCHECAGQSPYQDPTLTITADSANRITEGDEANNTLRQ